VRVLAGWRWQQPWGRPGRAARDRSLPSNAALQAGEADKALALLNPLAQRAARLSVQPQCRVEYTLEQWDRAASDCEQAVKLDGRIQWITCAGSRAGREGQPGIVSECLFAGQAGAGGDGGSRPAGSRNADALADLASSTTRARW